MDETEPPEPTDDDMDRRLSALERVLGPVLRPGTDALRSGTDALRSVSGRVVTPAWQRATDIESRVPVMCALAVAITLTALLPARVANHPRWLLPGLAAILFVIVLAVNPYKSPDRARQLRPLTFALLAVVSLGNAASAARLVDRPGERRGHPLRRHAAADRRRDLGDEHDHLRHLVLGVRRRWTRAAAPMNMKPLPDFLFPQMTLDASLVRSDWEPHFVDYLYLSFTNATAFSPTDVMPLTYWTKLTMMAQSIVSLTVVVLVVARAVNVL